jgi:hypothetical protein
MSKTDEIFEEIELLSENSNSADTSALSMKPALGNADQVIRHFSNCQICGGRLHFNYVSDFSRNTTQEKAVCPECGLDSREALHRLQ